MASIQVAMKATTTTHHQPTTNQPPTNHQPTTTTDHQPQDDCLPHRLRAALLRIMTSDGCKYKGAVGATRCSGRSGGGGLSG